MRICAKTIYTTKVNAFKRKKMLYKGLLPHMEILEKNTS